MIQGAGNQHSVAIDASTRAYQATRSIHRVGRSIWHNPLLRESLGYARPGMGEVYECCRAYRPSDGESLSPELFLPADVNLYHVAGDQCAWKAPGQ